MSISTHLLLLLSLQAAVSLADGILGFNYGSHWSNYTAKTASDFQRQFERARAVRGSPSHARLFTTVQHETADDVIAALQPAIDTQTRLLLGLWPYQGGIEHELIALNRALDLYGHALVDLLDGISVGNEDLHRAANGCDPDCADAPTVKRWIDTVRANVSSGPFAAAMADKKIGHVDTVRSWAAGGPGTAELIASCDFVGVTIYPSLGGVSVQSSAQSVLSLLADARSVAGAKPVFVAETGWPWAGAAVAQAQAGPQNVKQYWDVVACKLLVGYDAWWNQLEDDSHDGYQWGVLDSATGQPRFDVACAGDAQRTSSSALAVATSSPGSSWGNEAVSGYCSCEPR
jgi:glucan endo-1,3-beta-D-glucosidase